MCPNSKPHFATLISVKTVSYTVLTSCQCCANSYTNAIWCAYIQLCSSCTVNLKSRGHKGCRERHQDSQSDFSWASIPSVFSTNTAVEEGERQTYQAKKIVLISQRLRSFICHYLVNYSLIRTLGKKSSLIALKSSFSSAPLARVCYFCLPFLIIPWFWEIRCSAMFFLANTETGNRCWNSLELNKDVPGVLFNKWNRFHFNC